MNYPTRGSETVPYRYDLLNMVVWQDVPSVFRAIRADVNQGGRPLPERQNHLTRSREGREERDVDRLPNHLLASSLRVFAPSREKRGSTNPRLTSIAMIQNAPAERQNHLTRSREGREERDVDRLPNHLLASSLRVFAPSREKRGSTNPRLTSIAMIQNAPGERQNHLTRSREGREERDVDRLPNNLLASSLRVFAPSREKRYPRTPRLTSLMTIANASGFILDHPDDSECIGVHFGSPR